MTLEARLKARAQELGFARVGIAPASEADGFDRFVDWLDAGRAGEMAYLQKHREARRHPRSLLPTVQSVVMLALTYTGFSTRPGTPARVAAYAQGPDYHAFIRDRENTLADWLTSECPGSVARGVVDTAPLLERDFARRAGLGWFGKNTMLIDKHLGSGFFLGAVLTDVRLQPDPPHIASHCGSCTACLDACPTAAFPEPGQLDARRCISYLTIEHRTAIPLDLREGIGNWLFGCDICQEVCPWNRRPGLGVLPHDDSFSSLDPIALLGLTDAEFRQRFRGTSLFRSKRSGILRNAAIVLGNTGDQRAIPALERAIQDDDELIREAAQWALTRVRQRCGLV